MKGSDDHLLPHFSQKKKRFDSARFGNISKSPASGVVTSSQEKNGLICFSILIFSINILYDPVSQT